MVLPHIFRARKSWAGAAEEGHDPDPLMPITNGGDAG